VAIRVLAIKGLFSQLSICSYFSGPGKLASPGKSADTRMKISTFASIEVSPVFEKVPLYRADRPRLGLFEVDISEFITWVCNEYAAETVFNVLHVRSSSEITEVGTETPRSSTGNVVRGPNATIGINSCLENSNLLIAVSKRKNVGYNWSSHEVIVQLLKRVSIDGGGVDSVTVPLFDRGEGEDFVEEPLELRRRVRVEVVEPEAEREDFFKVRLQVVAVGFVLAKGPQAGLLVHEDPAELHLRHGSLKGFLELINGAGLVVELREKGFEDLGSDAAVKGVVDP
jgi:hypothetical protein